MRDHSTNTTTISVNGAKPGLQPRGTARRRRSVKVLFHVRSMQVAVPVKELIHSGLARLIAVHIAEMRKSSTTNPQLRAKSLDTTKKRDKDSNNGK